MLRILGRGCFLLLTCLAALTVSTAPLLTFLSGFLCSYLLVTLTESFMHDRVLHAGKPFRRFQSRFPRVCYPLLQGWRSHTRIHHGSTFRRDHVTQFDDAAHRARVDAMLTDGGGVRIIREDYGITMKFRSVIFFLVPLSPFVVAAIVTAPLEFSLGFLIPVALYPLMSKVIHPFLHMRYRDALGRAPFWLRPVLRTSYIRLVWRHHWLHHRYPRNNFNLLLGGDLLRRVHRWPSPSDRDEMRDLGIPVD